MSKWDQVADGSDSSKADSGQVVTMSEGLNTALSWTAFSERVFYFYDSFVLEVNLLVYHVGTLRHGNEARDNA